MGFVEPNRHTRRAGAYRGLHRILTSERKHAQSTAYFLTLYVKWKPLWVRGELRLRKRG